jgi:hypothetical protein
MCAALALNLQGCTNAKDAGVSSLPAGECLQISDDHTLERANIVTANLLELRTSTQKFFDEFVVAFRSFDGAVVALRYLTPYLAFHSDGSAEVFLSSADTADYFQRILDSYRDKGCRSCRYTDLDMFPLGQNCVVATVTWELLGEDAAVLEAWRESYNLSRVESRYKVFTSTDHIEARQ